MKIIKSYLKQNYKRLIVQFVAVISALVIFTVPAFATEYSLTFNFYDGYGSGSINTGGIYYYVYNYYNSKYIYHTEVEDVNGKLFRYAQVDKQFNTVAAIFNQPVNAIELQNVLGDVRQKFYIEFPVYVHFGTLGNKFDGNFNCYLSAVNFLLNDGESEKKYSVDVDIDGFINSDKLSYKIFSVGFVIEPEANFLDITTLSMNFQLTNQSSNYYVSIAPNGPVKVKIGDDIPAYAPVASAKIDELDSVEQELQNKTQAGVNEADKIFDNAGNVFSKTNVVGTSVMAATKIFNALLKTDVFNDILNVALVLGIFAFLLGLGGVAASLWNKHDRNNKGG